MNIMDIKDIIIQVANQDMCCKSVLIDGDWGCGKTTIIKEAIDEISKNKNLKKKIIYQSLFGIKDVDELTMCYSNVANGAIKIGKAIVTPFVKSIPYVGEEVHASLDNATALFNPNFKRKNKVFIFDDLERVDSSFSYISLMGFFNQLLLRDCIIICISSLNGLSKINLERKDDLCNFIEKSFDRVFYINEAPTDIIIKIFSDLENISQVIKKYIKTFENNLRLAIKVHRLLSEIETAKSVCNYNFNRINNEQFLKAAILCIMAVYTNVQLESIDEKEKNKSYLEWFIAASDKPLEKRVLKRINEELSNNGEIYLPEEKDIISELSRCFSYVEIHNDYSELERCYGSKEEKQKSDNQVNESIFYLSDEDKKKRFENLVSKILNNEVNYDKSLIDEIVDIFKYTRFDFKQDGLIEHLSSHIAKEAINGNKTSLNRLEDYISFPRESGDEKVYTQIEEIYDKSNELYRGTKNSELSIELMKYYQEKDYASLTDFIYDVANFKKPQFIRDSFNQLLLDNNFYLPNLRETINYNSWSYCHEVARYVRDKENLEKPFLSLLEKIAKENSDSDSAVDRINALVKYNFNK